MLHVHVVSQAICREKGGDEGKQEKLISHLGKLCETGGEREMKGDPVSLQVTIAQYIDMRLFRLSNITRICCRHSVATRWWDNQLFRSFFSH